MPHKVLFVQSQTEVGGAETSLLTSLAAINAKQLEPTVAVLGFGQGDLPDRLKAVGVEVFEFAAGRLRNPLAWMRACRRLAHIARRTKAAMLVANGYHPHLYARPAARSARARSAVFCHDFPAEKGDACLIERVSFSMHSDAYLAPSVAMVRAVEERVSSHVPVYHVPNGTDTTRFHPDAPGAAAFRSEMGVGASQLMVTLVGRLQPWKGQHVFLDAAAKAAQADQNLRFVLVGEALFGQDEDYPRQLQKQASLLGVDDKVTFAGNRTDMPAVYSASDMVVHCSVHPEPFGVVIIEAMAAGCPVLVSRDGGAAELFDEGLNGMGYALGDANELARLMVTLARDRNLREKLGINGRKHVVQQYSAASSAEALTRAVKSTLAPSVSRSQRMSGQ